MEGYHSPQVDVDGAAQHQRVARAAARRRGATRSPPSCRRVDWHRYPDRAATALRDAHRRRCTASRAEQVFAANGSNEVLQTLLPRPTAGPAARSPSFEPTYALHSPHRPAHRRPTVVEGERTRRLRARPRPRCDAVIGDVRRRRSRSSARPTTRPGMVEPRGDGARRSRRGRRRSRRRRRGLRAVRAVVGARARRRGRAARRHPHVLEDVVDGRGPARLPGRPVVARRPSSTRSCCRTTSTPSSRSPGALALDFVDEMEARGSLARSRSGGGSSPACATCRSSVAVGRQLRPVPARPRRRRRRVAGAARPLGARAQLLVVAPPRRLPAGHPRHARRGRRASSPRWPEVLAMTRSSGVTQQRSHQGDRRSPSTLDVDGAGHGRRVDTGFRSSTTCSTSSAATAASTSTVDATGDLAGRRPPHRRGRRHPARRGVPRGARRQGRRAPVRERPVPARRGAGRGRARPVGPARSSSTTCRSARCCRSATRRSTPSWPSTSGSRSPPRPASRCT